MTTLKQLKRKESVIRKALVEIHDEIDEFNEKKEVPALRKKYIGKYFKFWNGDGTRHWWLYYKVIGIESANQANTFSFQAFPNWDNDGMVVEIETNDKIYMHNLGEICSESEFNTQYNKALELIKVP